MHSTKYLNMIRAHIRSFFFHEIKCNGITSFMDFMSMPSPHYPTLQSGYSHVHVHPHSLFSLPFRSRGILLICSCHVTNLQATLVTVAVQVFATKNWWHHLQLSKYYCCNNCFQKWTFEWTLSCDVTSIHT